MQLSRLKWGMVPLGIGKCGIGSYKLKNAYVAASRRNEWILSHLRKGLLGFYAEDRGKLAGHIISIPLSDAPVALEGDKIYYIPCIWSLPDYGVALKEMLLTAIIDDIRRLTPSTAGVTMLSSDCWLHKSTFLERFGFERKETVQQSHGDIDIMFLPFEKDAIHPVVLYPKIPQPRGQGDTLDLFHSDFCPYQTLLQLRLINECKKNNIKLQDHNSDMRNTIMEYGIAFGAYLNGQDITEPLLRGHKLSEIRLVQ